MIVAEQTLELEVEQEIHSLINRAHTTTMKTLIDLGGSDEITSFYGVKYNKDLRVNVAPNGSGEIMYTGGDESDYRNNMLLFQKINTDVLCAIKNGRPYFDERRMPDILRKAIIEHAGL